LNIFLFIALGSLGKYEEAIECFDKALDIDQNDASIWDNKGFVLGSLGRREEAIECFDKAVKIDPNMTDARKYRDLAYKKLGRKSN
jgi:tetratricopeptide (TPR) repeat protein